ncbi:MAG TPA: ABC transporter substrate-binding protein [Geminicoccaceae bacterium]|nr:ABC transporter substrate-binding protein [Geminicoccaceae bacterium]
MRRLRTILAGGLALPALLLFVTPDDVRAQDRSLHVALGDVATVETLHFLIALENVRERGVEVELTEFNAEDMAAQAVVNGQADVGVGTPYALIQRMEAPIRVFAQLSTLKFYPVVDKEAYPDWQALDGEGFAYHARGSGTEAMGNLMAEREGIEFGEISYVPGSEVRAIALLQGNIKATFLDIANKNLVMREAPDRFHVLPTGDVEASDEALFARRDWLDENEETVQILLEELIKVWRRVNEDPSWVAAERERLGLLPDLPAELEAEIQPYFEQAAAEGMFPDDGGREGAARSDLEFYTEAGQIEGDPAELNVEDFWYLEPLDRALQTVGG